VAAVTFHREIFTLLTERAGGSSYRLNRKQ